MKTLIKIATLLSLILITGLLSCGKSKNPVNPTSGFTIDNFPHEIGTVWVYQRYWEASLAFSTDTLFVRIDGTTQITDDSLFVYVVIADLVTEYAESSDTTYWHISGDTVIYYRPDADSFKVVRKLIFPLEVGSNWSIGVFPPDSTEVTEIFAKTILGKSYQNAYQIVREAYGLNEYYLDSFLYVPNIGLVQSDEYHRLWTTTKDETWNLISFYDPDSLKLSDFPLQVGASWTYNVYDNLVDCAPFVDCFDTCTVTILDSIMDRGGIINENWLFDYPGLELIKKNRLDQNKLFIQWHHYALFFSLEFPLTVGKQWTDNPSTPMNFSTVQVIGRQTVETPAGRFVNAYHLKGYTVDGFEPGVDFEIWIAKGYGIVKLNHSGPPMGSNEDKSWELKSYVPNKPFPSFTIDKFPNMDGLSWTYEVYSSLLNNYDTLFVQVAESSTVALWNYTNSDTSWHEIVSIEETVIKFSYTDNLNEPYKSYQFPIELNNDWITPPLNSHTTVNGITIIDVPAGRFFPCYSVETNYVTNVLDLIFEKEWIYPKIGLVYKAVLFSEPSDYQTWRLIDYRNP